MVTRSRFVEAVWALLTVVLLGLAACAPLPSGHAGPDATLMTFNIRTSSADDGVDAWGKRARHVAASIASQSPDILGLQEAEPDQIAFLAEQLPAYRFIARSRETDPGRGEAVPLFFHAGRWSLDPAEHGTFWLSDTPALPGSKTWGNHFPRIVTWARLVHRESGRALYVYNLHLDHESETARQKSAELVSERAALRTYPDPVVVMGDLNAEPGSPVLKRLLGGELELRDTLRDNGNGNGTFHGFTGESKGRRIDYILVSPGPVLGDAAIIDDPYKAGAYPSDHFPVVATIRLGAG